jgi:hypothetical protein
MTTDGLTHFSLALLIVMQCTGDEKLSIEFHKSTTLIPDVGSAARLLVCLLVNNAPVFSPFGALLAEIQRKQVISLSQQ